MYLVVFLYCFCSFQPKEKEGNKHARKRAESELQCLKRDDIVTEFNPLISATAIMIRNPFKKQIICLMDHQPFSIHRKLKYILR